MEIGKIVREANDNAKRHGWNEYLTVLEMLALIHSEISEAVEILRDTGNDFYKLRITRKNKDFKPEGFPIELADIIIRTCNVAGRIDMNLEGAIREKLNYNKTRPIKHGRKI